MKHALSAAVALTIIAVAGTSIGCDKSAPAPTSTTPVSPVKSAAPAEPVVALHYEIDGMSCSGCVDAITAKVTKVPGVTSCTVDLDSKHAVIEAGAADDDAVRAAIERLGYKVKSVPVPTAG